jgi:hypothetical protein
MSAKFGVSHRGEKYHRSTKTRFTVSGGRKVWVKARRLKLIAPIARGTRRVRKNLVAKRDESVPLERSGNRWKDNIKIDYEKPAFEDTNWSVQGIGSGQDPMVYYSCVLQLLC